MCSFQEPRWIGMHQPCHHLNTIQSRAPDHVADQVTDGGVGLAVISLTVELSTVWHLKTYLLQTSWMWRRNRRSPASLYTRHCGTDCGSPRASRGPHTSMAVRQARPVFERWGMASSPYAGVSAPGPTLHSQGSWGCSPRAEQITP